MGSYYVVYIEREKVPPEKHLRVQGSGFRVQGSGFRV